jgi:hypothetical protein
MNRDTVYLAISLVVTVPAFGGLLLIIFGPA